VLDAAQFPIQDKDTLTLSSGTDDAYLSVLDIPHVLVLHHPPLVLLVQYANFTVKSHLLINAGYINIRHVCVCIYPL